MAPVTLDQPIYVAKAELFKALGHPARIRVLELLVEGDSMVSELLAEIDVEPSSLSQHLSVLKRSGMVESFRSGNSVTYRIADPSVAEFLQSARGVLLATLDKVRETLEDLHASERS